MSLASRLAIVIFTLVAGVSFLVAYELTRREREHHIESKRRAGEMLTELFSASIAPALDFSDKDALATSLAMLSQNEEVVDALVWSLEKEAPLARLAASKQNSEPRAPPPGVHVAAERIEIVHAINNPTGKQLGTVALSLSLAQENAVSALARKKIFWLAFMLSAFVAALLVAVLRKTIISPLAQLERAARRLARGELTEVTSLRQDEVGNLGHTFNHMGQAIAEREGRISAMNARLQSLLDNMRQAIVVFDAEGRLSVERSKLARRLFGDAAGPKTSIVDLLYPGAYSSAVEADAFRAWLLEAAKTNEQDFDELSELAPREVTLQRNDGQDQVLELEFRSAQGETNAQRFMLLATDVTAQRKLERSAEAQEREHQKQLTAMRRLLAGGGQVFVRFLSSARKRLGAAQEQLNATQWTRSHSEQVFRFVHTLRAEARSFDLARVEALASELEFELSGTRHAPADSMVHETARQKLRAGLSALADELNRAEALFVESSPIGRRVLEQITVSRHDVEELFQRLAERKDELGKLAGRLAARPFGELLSTLPEACERWANKEGKRIALVVHGREVLVPAPLCDKLSGALAHLLRNAIAHGIERKEERLAQQKAEMGRIEVVCREVQAGVVIEVTDDGAGFDIEGLELKANVPGHTAGLELAFVAGVSTRQSPDDLAGHGVGLGAVRDDLGRVGYAVSVTSKRGHGARIVLEPAPR
jgi:two-component system, chemotaxis family, sensor kinase CheA